MKPSVSRLPCHLPNEQSVFVHEDQDLEQALQSKEKTELTQWFKLNQDDPDARQYLYVDILRYYIYDKKNKVYKKRTNNRSSVFNDDENAMSDTISRIPYVPLNVHTKENYFLRMLLHHIPGAQSFEDLMTVNGYICQTFQEACIMLGLFEDDSEGRKALEEAADLTKGVAVIRCFVHLLIHSIISNARDLYEDFKSTFCLYLMKQARVDVPTEEMHDQVLSEIKNLLEENGKTMAFFNLPEPKDKSGPNINRIIDEELAAYPNDDIQLESTEEALNRLNTEQKEFVQAVDQAVQEGNGGVFALVAPAGTGKKNL